jgi:hypothetical protein
VGHRQIKSGNTDVTYKGFGIRDLIRGLRVELSQRLVASH